MAKHRKITNKSCSPVALSWAVMGAYKDIVEGFPIIGECPMTWLPEKKMIVLQKFSPKDHLHWVLINMPVTLLLGSGSFFVIIANRILRLATNGAWFIDDGVSDTMALLYVIAAVTVSLISATFIPIIWRFTEVESFQGTWSPLAERFLSAQAGMKINKHIQYLLLYRYRKMIISELKPCIPGFPIRNQPDLTKLSHTDKQILFYTQIGFRHMTILPFVMVPVILLLGIDPYNYLFNHFLAKYHTRCVLFWFASFFFRCGVYIITSLEFVRICNMLIAIGISLIMVFRKFGHLWQEILKLSPMKGMKTGNRNYLHIHTLKLNIFFHICRYFLLSLPIDGIPLFSILINIVCDESDLHLLHHSSGTVLSHAEIVWHSATWHVCFRHLLCFIGVCHRGFSRIQYGESIHHLPQRSDKVEKIPAQEEESYAETIDVTSGLVL